MRALKTILIIVLAVAVILVILAYTGPRTSSVKRSVFIAAPATTIYPMVASLRASHAWGPWKDMEKDVKNEWSEADAVVGAHASWEGDTLGRGSQRIIALEQNRLVRTELRLLDPWEMTNEVALELVPEAEGTRVDWSITHQNKGAFRLIASFFDMDKEMGPDLERGLQNLKAKAEAEQQAMDAALRARTHRGYVIETVERPQTTYIGKRQKKLKWNAIEKFFSTHLGAAYGAIGAAGLEAAGQPCGIYFEWNEVDQTTDLMAAIPVKADESVTVRGFETYTIPQAKMLHLPYHGSYDGMMEAHLAMDEMIRTNGLTHYGNVIEEYVTDPSSEPDTSKWLTNIYYMVR